MVNLSIKEQLIILQERLNSVFQMTKLLKEYYSLSEKLSDTEYGLYFEVMYSYIARYIVLEFYRLCDNDNDCVSIPKLKKEVLMLLLKFRNVREFQDMYAAYAL